jgi:hypothetical protein
MVSQATKYSRRQSTTTNMTTIMVAKRIAAKLSREHQLLEFQLSETAA